MDALTRLLDGPRGGGAYLVRARMEPPWGVRIQDRAPVGLMAVLQGTAWVSDHTGESVALRQGDVAVLRGPDEFTVGDDPSTRPQVILHPGLRCTSHDGEEITDRFTLGPRLWGNSAGGSTTLLLGCQQLRGEVSKRLLAALPTMLTLPEAELDPPLIPLLADEMTKDGPGQGAVLDRLFDLVFAAVLRTWFSRDVAQGPAWYRAYGDPVVARALRLLHDEPARPWTVARLAACVGVSRAALAKRFTETVGEAPMAYLTGWRLALAADRVRDRDATLEAVAREVGYGSGFALSAAFKRERGISPREHRARMTRTT
ncbi:AraC family transcriptional regulator [Micromonospora sp. NBC_01796]|uniref:AraC family transcriptional regulator n=1 Tax=Micromonospora sp. NBC_01796 TaxID=2975987 RepID=UPI002DD9D1A4|nr:AraC family transcriptional regulator [Micromonospora sp. NBC_01796]WSA84643.1 AraC family transcriptional regulator [Micromonospora sp. NBC_01796]